jgi:hypothetical protein
VSKPEHVANVLMVTLLHDFWMTGNPEVVGSSVGLVPINALVRSKSSRFRHIIGL